MAVHDEPGTTGSLLGRQRQLEDLDRLARRFGQSLSGALDAGAESGRRLGASLDGIGELLSRSLGSGIETALSTGLRGAGRALGEAVSAASFGGGALPFASGGVFAGGAVQPFAEGGIVSAPTYFPLGRGLGLMGEAGAEAIMPLARGSDGRLGIRAGPSAAPSVTINVTTPDADSFRRSEAQVAAALARAVGRGRRAL